jgi:hypothetical protein
MLLKSIVLDRGKFMAPKSHFEILTNRYATIQERTRRLVCDLQRLIRLLDYDINFEEERTGISDLAHSNYSGIARQLRARRDNLAATICELEIHAITYH